MTKTRHSNEQMNLKISNDFKRLTLEGNISDGIRFSALCNIAGFTLSKI